MWNYHTLSLYIYIQTMEVSSLKSVNNCLRRQNWKHTSFKSINNVKTKCHNRFVTSLFLMSDLKFRSVLWTYLTSLISHFHTKLWNVEATDLLNFIYFFIFWVWSRVHLTLDQTLDQHSAIFMQKTAVKTLIYRNFIIGPGWSRVIQIPFLKITVLVQLFLVSISEKYKKNKNEFPRPWTTWTLDHRFWPWLLR